MIVAHVVNQKWESNAKADSKMVRGGQFTEA